MTSNARHSEDTRLAAALAKSRPTEVASPTACKVRPSNITWIVAACACLTAFVVKMSQQLLIWSDQAHAYTKLTSTFDWAAILLCICALALFALQNMPVRNTPNEQRSNSSSLPTPERQPGNLALPAPDESRLRLAQSVSHELRTPLNAVIGFTDLMNHQLHGNLGHPKYNEYCAHISASSQSLLKAVDDILALNSDLGTDLRNRVPLPVTRALQTAWDDNAPGTHAYLEISGDPDPKVIAEPEILSHALKNLVNTLTRHTASGTTIRAVIRNEDSKTRIYCTACMDKSRLTETAPLAGTASDESENSRMSRDTLAEAAAEALVRSMDGELMIRQPVGTFNLEVICDLPAPRNENTLPLHVAAVS